MKIRGFQQRGLALAAAVAVAFLTNIATNMFAQDAVTPAPVATTPILSPAAAQVLQLSEAKISDGTIITFVQNSGSAYGLSASQIVYLKQQGVSEPVLNAMLTQHPAPMAVASPAPMDNTAAGTAATAAVAQPSSPAPDSSSVYVVPDTQTYYYNSWAYPYYYPYYGYYGWPAGVSFYWGHGGYYHGGGWGGGWHGGGGSWHGGGGSHGGGGWHH